MDKPWVLHDFRAMGALLLLFPNSELNFKVTRLSEFDLRLIKKVMGLMKAVFFGEQPGRDFFKKRLMPGVPLLYQDRKATFQKVLESVQSSC